MPDHKESVRIVIVDAPRPDTQEDEDRAYLEYVRTRLGSYRASNLDDLQFVECDSCASKPGSPVLCAGCQANRYVITKLRSNSNKGD